MTQSSAIKPSQNPIAPPKMPSSGYAKKALIGFGILLIIIGFLMDDDKTSPPKNNIVTVNASFKADGTEARNFISEEKAQGKKTNLKAAFTMANEFAKAEQPLNAYLMYFFAARQGHGPSAMQLAKQADPVTQNTDAEPFQAYKWYSVAQKAGMENAANKLSELKQWLLKSADNGDINAQRLLLQWNS